TAIYANFDLSRDYCKKIILLGNINKGLKTNILNLEENIKNGKLKSCFCCTRESGSKKYEGTSFLLKKGKF
ncbi:hypothetical protein, partial [Acinetobacter baumannii]|uniref:hypothetical protein n=1 Tax=Acinetobacter baumannii TaxID=470 RepID=UPI001C08321D